jgi:hypothetical protein
MPAPGHAVAAQVSAAAVISCVTSAGRETMATWLAGTSMVVAPMRLANSRSASGGMAWSWVATRYQDGSDFQAGTPITSVKVEPAKGCRTACITLARTVVDVSGEVLDEVVLREPAEALVVGEQVRPRRRRSSLG